MKRLFPVLGLLIFLTTQAYATWSIIAVDRKTGEIGIAGASCTFDVQGIASIVPGRGAIVVQASSSYFARMKGVDLMENNKSIEEILTAMRNQRYKPEKQQYGVVVLDRGTKPLVYSGTKISSWSGEIIGADIAVLGNILVSENVLKKAFEAFNKNRNKTLAERLMLALRAGEQAGGDKRCGSQYARSAFISVYRPVNGSILKLSVYGIKEGGKPAVTLLAKEFEYWRKEDEKKNKK
ncbi:hypothetical protein BKI52_34885 [marine bacterium AO1-C]|nr:hypothetical protein BKI52_34885 [marine bacterium AO1-C]